MARILPSYISPDIKSAAERKIYQLIKDAPGLDDVVSIHSLGLAQHIWKRQGEVDFVLVGQKTIICLEVKGGRVDRKEGVWFFTDRYGRENKKAESPFAQASSAMYSLKSRMEANFGGDTGYTFGYGVMLPDINFIVNSPEWDPEIVYDLGNAIQPVSEYIHKLEKYWNSKAKQMSPSRRKQEEVVEYLRGDFELATPLWKQIEDSEVNIAHFSSEQCRALDHMEGNKRVLFVGGAGTGKTLLAMEKCRRGVLAGQKVLLLCFNKLLGAKLHSETSALKGPGEVHAGSIHKFFLKAIRKAGLYDDLKRKAASGDKSLYDKVFSGLFVEAFQKLKEKQYDLLVVDEGQDLLSAPFLEAFDVVVKGGLKDGEWIMFLDPGAQARLFNRLSLEAYEHLKSLGTPEYRLGMNCRNTVQIAMQTTIVSGFPTGIAKLEGSEVEYILYSSDDEEAFQVVDLVRALVEKENVPPGAITILSAKDTGSMSLIATGVRMPSYIRELTEENVDDPLMSSCVTYASVQSFKGLENSIIIYTDIRSLEDSWHESVNYVGMSRARERLYVFLPKRMKAEYNKRMVDFAKNGYSQQNVATG